MTRKPRCADCANFRRPCAEVEKKREILARLDRIADKLRQNLEMTQALEMLVKVVRETRCVPPPPAPDR